MRCGERSRLAQLSAERADARGDLCRIAWKAAARFPHDSTALRTLTCSAARHSTLDQEGRYVRSAGAFSTAWSSPYEDDEILSLLFIQNQIPSTSSDTCTVLA